jgi:hypothetical protein
VIILTNRHAAHLHALQTACTGNADNPADCAMSRNLLITVQAEGTSMPEIS